MAVKIQLRGDTKANWLLANPVISEREMVLETDTGKYKIGNGVKKYADLTYHGIDGKPSRITTDGFWEIYNPVTDTYTKTEHKAIPADVQVVVKTNTATVYILTFTYAAGSFDTPNLRGQNGTTYDDTVVRNALTALQQQVNTLVSGDASNAIESFNEIVAFLASVEDSQTLTGIIAGLNQSIANVRAAIPTIPGLATPTANGLMSSTDKQRGDNALVLTDVVTLTSLSSIPVDNKYSLLFTYTVATAQPINFASTPTEGKEYMIDIKNATSSNITQAIPNASAWQCEETSLVIPAGKIGCISIRYVHGKYCVRVGL